MHRAQETSNDTSWSLKKAFAGCAWVVQVWALHTVQIPGAFGLMWSTHEARCLASGNQTAQSRVRTACTALSSLPWESLKTRLFPSWLPYGCGLRRGSVPGDPP